MGQRAFTFDKNLQMKDAGAVTASAAAQVGGADKILDLGAGRVEGTVVLDVSAIDIVTGDEKYEVEFQLSPDATFGTAGDIRCAHVVKLGDATVNGSGADSTTGRYEMPVVNEFNGTVYRYARLYTRAAGTTPSINYTGFLAKAS